MKRGLFFLIIFSSFFSGICLAKGGHGGGHAGYSSGHSFGRGSTYGMQGHLSGHSYTHSHSTMDAGMHKGFYRKHLFAENRPSSFHIRYYGALYFLNFYYFYPLPADIAHTLYQPYDGYIVCRKDTLSGTITIANRYVFFERKLDEGHGFKSAIPISDTGLKEVVLYEGDNNLCLARPENTDKRLWRVVHDGKLCVYDDRYDFIQKPEDIDKQNLRLIYGGKVITIDKFMTGNTKKAVVASVNEAYGLKLDNKDYSWKELLIYIDKLN